jgi:hypothetical protein
MKKPLIVSIITGFIIWTVPILFFDTREAWDFEGGYYFYALLLSGACSGIFISKGRELWIGPCGIFLGQLLAIVFIMFTSTSSGANFFFPLGVILLAVYTLFSFVGTAVSFVVKIAIRKVL